MCILRQNISGQVVVCILAVEEDQVGECLLWEWGVIQQEVQLFERSSRVFLDVHQGCVVQGDWIEFVLVAWGHVLESLFGDAGVLHREFDGRF